MMKIRFNYFVHDDPMISEIMENLSDKFPEEVDLIQVANRIKDFCYEVCLVFEWDTETNKLELINEAVY